MKVKCRKVTAVLLGCIWVFLSVAAEFSHHHNPPANGAVSVHEAQTGKDTGTANNTHSYDCVACHFAITHFAVSTTSSANFATAPALLFPLTLPVVDAQFLFQLSSLRAPPVALA